VFTTSDPLGLPRSTTAKTNEDVMVKATSNRSDGFATAVVVEGGLALVAAGLAWMFRVPLREQFPPLGQPLVAALVRGLVATVPMLVVFWCLLNLKWAPLRELRHQVEWLIREIFPTGSIPQFAMVALLAGVGEELLFRGVLQTKLGYWTTPAIGLVSASLLFGLAHALSKTYFAFAVAVGAYLGWLANYYHDLTAPIVAHALYDFLALIYLWRSAREVSADVPPVKLQPTATDERTRNS
jgi:membrane protease YdiL (CAAX protease family)